MADLIEIQIQADTRPVNNLVSALGKASNAANLADKNMRDLERSIKRGLGGGVDSLLTTFSRLERAGMSLSDVQKGLAQDSRMLAQSNQAQINSLLGVDRASKSARDSASAMASALDEQDRATRQNNASLQQAQRGYEQLRMAIDKNYAARMRIRQASQTLRQAVEAEIITTQQAAVMLRQYGASANTMGIGTQFASRRINDIGMATQQAGYQIGDFLVQVQSGTNAFVAFGQQATQLVGVLPAFAERLGVSVNRLIAMSSALGIIIPIATAVGAALMRTRSASQDSAAGIKSLEDRINSAKQAMEGFNEEIRRYATGARDAGEQALLEGVADSLETIRTLQAEIAENERLGTITAPNERALAAAQELLKSRQEELENYRASRREAELLGAAEERRVENMRLHVEYAERDARLIEERNAGVQRILQAVQAETQTLRDRAVLAAAERQFGADSVEFRTLQASIEERIYREQLSQNGILGKNQEEMVALRQSALRLEERLKGASEAAERLADALKAANTFSAGLDQSVATLEARLAEASGQQGAVLANTIRQMEAEADLNAMRARAAGDLEVSVMARRAIDQAQIDRYKELSEQIETVTANSRRGSRATKEVADETKKLANVLEGPLDSAIGSVSNAWADFVVRGFNDFKGFAQSVLNSFKNMIAQMIAIAARNRIMVGLGIAGGAAGSATAAGAAGLGNLVFGGGGGFGSIFSGIGSMLGMGGGFTGTFGAGMAATLTGGLSGAGGAIGAGLGMIGGGGGITGAISGLSMAIGAALPIIGAVTAAFSFFRSKTKELDSGLKITVSNMDALVQTFRTVEKSRFWGLSKRVSTTLEDASDEVSRPFVEAVVEIQKSVMDAAAAFGIAGSTFDNFVYQMDISLKDLTEDQKMEKINEELAKMGDEFAALTGHFETMNELLEAANQRMQLQNRLDQLLGNNAAILARQREAELAAMHELNRPLAQAIYNLEDAQMAFAQADQAVGQAFGVLRAAIDAEKAAIRGAFDSVMDGLRERLDAANESLSRSRSIFEALSGALSGRFVSQGASSTFARRESALGFIRGGDFADEERLDEALRVVSEPTEDLFGSFVEYARDFARTTRVIEDAESTARLQLSADEKSVLLLEEQIKSQEEGLQAQLIALDEQYAQMEKQYAALLGIDTSVKGVGAAISNLQGAIANAAAAAAQAAAAAAAASAAANAGANVGGGGTSGGGGGGGPSFAEQFGTGGTYQGYNLAAIGSAAELVQAAASLGVQTAGQSGAAIQQAISNASGMAVQLGNDVRAQQFAMGGYHTGGLRMVGERGPELEATGPSRIFSHNQTAGMFRDPDLKDAVRSLKEEVAGLRSEQRQIQMDISKYTKRTYDIERKWDVEGLPATRT